MKMTKENRMKSAEARALVKNVKLPRRWANGTKMLKHPLLIGLEQTCAREEISLRQLAMKHLGVTQQSLEQWMRAAEESRDYLVPAHRVPQFSLLFGIEPHYFNPVMWRQGWVFK